MRPSSFFSGGAKLVCESSCGVGFRVPSASPRSVSTISGAPASASRAASSGACFVRSDFRLVFQQHGPGVEACVDLHGGEAGAGLAIRDRPVDGRRAAIFRQQRAVQVDPAEARNRDKPGGDDLPVGDDDDHVRSDAC